MFFNFLLSVSPHNNWIFSTVELLSTLMPAGPVLVEHISTSSSIGSSRDSYVSRKVQDPLMTCVLLFIQAERLVALAPDAHPVAPELEYLRRPAYGRQGLFPSRKWEDEQLGPPLFYVWARCMDRPSNVRYNIVLSFVLNTVTRWYSETFK